MIANPDLKKFQKWGLLKIKIQVRYQSIIESKDSRIWKGSNEERILNYKKDMNNPVGHTHRH